MNASIGEMDWEYALWGDRESREGGRTEGEISSNPGAISLHMLFYGFCPRSGLLCFALLSVFWKLSVITTCHWIEWETKLQNPEIRYRIDALQEWQRQDQCFILDERARGSLKKRG